MNKEITDFFQHCMNYAFPEQVASGRKINICLTVKWILRPILCKFIQFQVYVTIWWSLR